MTINMLQVGIADNFEKRISEIAGNVSENLAIVVRETKGGVLFRHGDSYIHNSEGGKAINTLCIEAYQGNNTNRVFVVWRKPRNEKPIVVEHRGRDLFLENGNILN